MDMIEACALDHMTATAMMFAGFMYVCICIIMVLYIAIVHMYT